MNNDLKTLENSLVIFTDGSSLGNPGPGGYGAVLVFSTLNELIELGGSKSTTTNNEMELVAVVAALTYAVNNTSPIQIFTDSSYVLNGAKAWMYGWEKNDWHKKDGQEVKNRFHWEALYKLIEARGAKSITWNHVPGHVGIVGNERVDDIARGHAEGKEIDLYRGTLSSYIHPNILEIKISEKDQKRKAKSKAKAYCYLSLVDDIIMKHNTWKEVEDRVKGKKAKFKKAISAEHEKEIVEEWKRMA